MNAEISFKVKGEFDKLEKMLAKAEKICTAPERIFGFEHYGQMGVDALAKATPKRTGKTAASWEYKIKMDSKSSGTITWNNTNVNKGVNIAIILDFGHGTGTGGYVAGRHYIDPASQEVFDKIEKAIDREVRLL